jgi:hypothetical protein
MTNRKKTSLTGKLVAVGLVALGAVACQAQATVGPPEECRNVEVRSRHDVEACHAHCNDNGCHEHCTEREHWAHEHRCWVE